MRVNYIPTVSLDMLTTGYTTKKKDIIITNDINAHLYSGEVTCLLGPNGAGKSTLLKTLTSFIPPLKGVINIFNKELTNYTASELSKTIGVVLTEKPDLTNMTVYELVKMGRSPYTGFWGHSSVNDIMITDEAIELVGIDSLRERMVQTLSDGERQKVMIAKALAQETPIIILDEPTAFLDYPSKVEIMQLLKKLARDKNKTIFLSIHDLELALQTADKIWLLDKKHGITIGTPEDLSLNDEINRYFHREGIVFDKTIGFFRIINDHYAEVSLSGEGPVFTMIRKALSRRGISITEDRNTGIDIITDQERMLVNGEEALSIEEIIDKVEHLIQKKLEME